MRCCCREGLEEGSEGCEGRMAGAVGVRGQQQEEPAGPSWSSHEIKQPRSQCHQVVAEDRSIRRAGWALPCSLPGGGVGALWSCVAPHPSAPPRRPPSPSSGLVGVEPRAQVVAPLRGSAARPLPGRGPLPAGGRADHVLLVVVVRPHGVQDAVERLPAERARSSRGSPPPDAAEAEGVEASVDGGCVVHLAQADGARAACRCLPPPCPLQLAGGGRHGRAARLRSLLSTRGHVLPRERFKVPELSWR